jgi:hypothetical protein
MSIHAQRLLNVALALRESRRPDMFDMGSECHDCGTPACAIGHYAARRDLQDVFEIRALKFYSGKSYADLYIYGEVAGAWWEEQPTCQYFGITPDEGTELFYVIGCDGAKTPTEAAEYIERFVQRKWGIDPAVRKLESELVTEANTSERVYV